MKKCQLVSMDFVLTMVVYIAALSLFFFSIKQTTGYNDSVLDVQPELAFGRMDEIDDTLDFLDGSIVDKTKLDTFVSNYDRKNPVTANFYAYDFFFSDFEDPRNYERIDYCVYLKDKDFYYKRFRAGRYEGYEDAINCSGVPVCNHKKMDSLRLLKPVLYDNKIVDMNILVCGTRN